MEVVTYVLSVFLPSLRVLDDPPEMTREVHCTTLIGLLKQLASVQRRLSDERVVVLLGEAARAVESTRDDADCLELGP